MTAPFVRRRTYMRRFAELGQSYRRAIEDANADRDKARADLRRFIDQLAPRVHSHHAPGSGYLILTVEVDDRLRREATEHELFEHVRDSIMRRLFGMQRDYRGDLRQTDTQRALGLSASRVAR